MQPLLVRSFLGEKIERLPVWIMRQAGRYLPEYRELRAKAGSFLDLCKYHAADITLQPLKRFDLDAAIIFADILLIPDAMGCGLEFVEGLGPKFKKTITTTDNLANLPFNVASLNYVYEAITKVKASLNPNQALIGFAGSPWTVACYMTEGGSSKNFHNILTMRYINKEFLQQLLLILTHNTIDYLEAQVKAGADYLMLFDSWGGILPMQDFHEYSIQYAKIILDHFNKKNIPIVFFARNSARNLQMQIDAGFKGIGIDWNVDDLKNISNLTRGVTIQGNLDPHLMCSNKSLVTDKTNEMLNKIGRKTNYIANLGHGIMPQAKVECVEAFIQTVHSYVT